MDWRQAGKDRFRRGMIPVGRIIVRTGITANHITSLGVILSAVSGYFLYHCRWHTGLLFLVLGACCDFLDGAVARAAGSTVKAGAFIDSTLDRYAELFVYGGLLGCFVQRGMTAASLGVFLAVGGSLLVSYTRARAEGLGFACAGGFAQRPERIILLCLGLIFGDRVLVWIIWIIAITSHLTAVYRFLSVLQTARSQERETRGTGQRGIPDDRG